MSDGFLRDVYDLATQEDTDAYYSRWASTYDEELVRNGYRTPTRAAEALASYAALDGSLLDVGCGTGLSGAAFASLGFSVVDGQDPNPDMAEIARSRRCYREVRVSDVADPYPFEPGRYAAMAAVGVIGPGAAPLELLDQTIDALAPGGYFVFSFNDHALELPEYAGAVDRLVAAGAVEQVVCERGPHIEALGSTSSVYVLRRA